jgi:glycosyltransferase involved in cell wall biosynthesis
MAGQSSIRLLIFDTILDGHHSDYIAHLVEYWCCQQIPGELYVVTPRGFSDSLTENCPATSRIVFMELTEQEIQQTRNSTRLSRSFTEWNLYVKYAREVQPDHSLIMYFDLFQVGVWLGKKSPCPISGIYFRPSFHYSSPNSWREKALVVRKRWLLRRVLTTPSLSALFCLDKSSVETIQEMTDQVRILPLSDPVRKYDLADKEVDLLKGSLGIQAGRKVFLVFGYLDERKGIEPVLDAIQMLTPAESSQLTLVLAGPITDSFRHTVDVHIASLNSHAQIICHFQELRGGAIQTLFEAADFVLTLYRRHIGMSSIVVRAALSEKPLISSDFGYLGSLVKAEELGAVVNSESPNSISKALRQALRDEVSFSRSAIKKLSEQNTSQLFAHQIMSELNVNVLAPVR